MCFVVQQLTYMVITRKNYSKKLAIITRPSNSSPVPSSLAGGPWRCGVLPPAQPTTEQLVYTLACNKLPAISLPNLYFTFV